MENTYGITSDGRLKLLPDKLLPQDIYCLDMFVEEQNGICEENLYVLICFPENIEENIRWETCFILYYRVLYYLSYYIVNLSYPTI